MSRAGLSITRDNGSLQIDDMFMTYRLIAKGSVYVAEFNANTGGGGATLSIAGKNPTLFLSDGPLVAVTQKTVSGGVHTWKLMAKTSGTATYYIFDEQVSADSGFGLQLFDEGGRLTFDSSSKLLRFVGSYQSRWASSGQLTLPYGRTYAVSNSSTVIGIQETLRGGTVMSLMLASSVRVSGSLVEAGTSVFGIIPQDPAYMENPQYYYGRADTVFTNIIDVTGF